MFWRLLQKVIGWFFVGAFLVVLVIGIFRVKKQEPELVSLQPESSNKITQSANESNQSSTNTSVGQVNAVQQNAPASNNSTNTTAPTQAPVKKTEEIDGSSYKTPWGAVTVHLSIVNGKIKSITTPDYPDSPPSVYAQSYLIREALQAGSANIQGVSGATYTSLAFQRSLESALAKATTL